MRNGVRLLGISIAKINIILLISPFALPDRLFTPLAMAFTAHWFGLLRNIFQLLSFFDCAKLREREIQHGLGSERRSVLLLGFRLRKDHRLGSWCHFLFKSILWKLVGSLWQRSRNVCESSNGWLFNSDFLLVYLIMQLPILALRFLVTVPKSFDNLLKVVFLFHKFFSLNLVDAVNPLIFNNHCHFDFSLLCLIRNYKSLFADLLVQAIR